MIFTLNRACKNLLLDKKGNKHTSKTYFNRNFKTTPVNQKWATDVSEFKIAADKLYLSPILDIYSREIVGYDISTIPNLFQTYRMLDMVFSKFTNLKKLVFIVIMDGNINIIHIKTN